MNHASPRRWLWCSLGLALLGLTWTVSLADPVDKDHAAKMAKGLDIFKKHVRPVLVQKCVKCHGGEATESEFDLTDRDRLLKGGEAGPAVIPGKAKDSLLCKLVAHSKEPHMPFQGRKLPDETIAQIAAWIDLGAPYDEPLIARPEKSTAWTQKEVPAAARRFWSFQPLRRAEPPAVRNEAWCRTPIDRFILANLEAAGIAPNPSADKRQLLRRAYLDLIGLPPTPEEVEAFLKDARPDAYQKLVERLLNSPRHGERWARHWLDLARFAESHGFEHDYDRPTAYPYRDFVIRAFNDDLPFDKFIKWQLAGDEYEPHNHLALAATGFLAAGVHSTQITKNEVEKHRYDELDDIVSTIGTAMLGLTIGCARCHDHKFDPFPQADYYRLVSAFTTTVRSEVDLKLDPEASRKAETAFEREHAPYAAAMKKFEDEQLPARLAEWEKTWPAQRERYPWVILDVDSSKSENGASFTKLDDSSLLAGGNNPPTDTYTFTASTDLEHIKAIRLEALADPSLVKGGPGRAANGNFALTDFRLTAAPKAGGNAIPVVLKNPRATFEQKGLPVRAAIDADPKSGWAIDPQFGKDHAAAFEVETPVGFKDGTILTFTLRFNNNTSHAIARPRLSVTTTGPQLELTGTGIPQKVPAILQLPADKRTPEQSAVLRTWYRTIDPEWRKLNQQAQNHLRKAPKPAVVKALISSEGLPPVRLHTQGDDFLKQTHFLRRGDPNQKEGVAAPGFLQVLMSAPEREKHWQQSPPARWRTSYRRRALAEWITDVDQGGGRLLARVIVNRLWQRHMGRGLVATPSDFGERGERPSHPELLDWLATELINNGWRLKPIHQLIVTSSVYRQGSQSDAMKAKVDRENRLWRRPSVRLEAEIIRDSMLAVSGALDERMFGPGTLDEESRRRSIYFTIKRSKLVPMMQVFDAPDAQSSIGERPSTTIAPQALLVMNNPHVRSWAQSFAKRLAPGEETTVEDAVKLGYQIALARAPSAEELADSAAFVNAQAGSYRAAGKTDARELALEDFCQVLMGLNEFVYVD